MTTERLHNGAWQVSAMVEVDGWGEYFFSRTYYGYTKRQAVALFREDCKRWWGA